MSVGLEIGFVTDKELDNVLVSILVDFSKPVFDVFERLSIGDVINEDDSVSSFVVRSSDGFESLLSSSVPNLELDGISSSFEGSNFKINSDGWQETELIGQNTFH